LTFPPAGWSVFGWDLDDGNAAVRWNEEEEEDLLVLLLQETKLVRAA